ncbi:MAG: ribose 5-phosphate isomerase B [Alphaproteobacteria bacterium]|nr:ribose 5-phosphate isomerase B [Alphaproteobacteria bacterium]
MKIAIAADHGGFELKEALKKHYGDAKLTDLGTFNRESVDYPDIAQIMVQTLRRHEADLGILICGTGIGISIAANRCKGIRAALIYSEETARLAKEHNNANIIVFGGRTMKPEDVIQYIDAFLAASYEGGRHQKRLDKLELME